MKILFSWVGTVDYKNLAVSMENGAPIVSILNHRKDTQFDKLVLIDNRRNKNSDYKNLEHFKNWLKEKELFSTIEIETELVDLDDPTDLASISAIIKKVITKHK